MQNDPSESSIESRICAHARATGWISYKFASPAHRGVPDRIFISPLGVVVFAEIKRRGKKPTPLQERELARIKAQGAHAYCFDNAGDGIHALDTLRYTRS